MHHLGCRVVLLSRLGCPCLTRQLFSTVLPSPSCTISRRPHGDIPKAIIRQLALMKVGRFAVLPILVVEDGYCVPDRKGFNGERWSGISQHGPVL